MRVLALASVFSLAATSMLLADPDPRRAPAPVEEIVERLVQANQAQQEGLRDLSMEVEIDASLPKLKKNGRLHAFRFISRLGEITYRAIRFDGDNTIKKDVIARYLAAETTARETGKAMGVTPENYRFRYKASLERDGQKVHILSVNPRKKRVGLFKGEIWVDAATYLVVREAGTFVKNPSVFLKKVEFVRDYEIREGMSLPSRIESHIQTRLVGQADMNIKYSNVTRKNSERASVAVAGEDQ